MAKISELINEMHVSTEKLAKELAKEKEKDKSEKPIKLGASIYISREAELGCAPVKRLFHSKHYEYIIGIGKDHTASLTIDEDALKELRKMGGINGY